VNSRAAAVGGRGIAAEDPVGFKKGVEKVVFVMLSEAKHPCISLKTNERDSSPAAAGSE